MLVCGFAYLKRRKTKHFLWSLLNKLRPSGITLVPRLLWSQILVIHAQQNVVKDYMRDHKPLYQSRISRNLRCSAEVGSNIVYLLLFLYVLSSFVHNMLLKCAFFLSILGILYSVKEYRNVSFFDRLKINSLLISSDIVF